MKRVVYGTWAACMNVVKKSRMKSKIVSNRLYDRYDIELLDDKELVINSESNEKYGRGMIGNILGKKSLVSNDEIYKLTLWKD